MNIILIVLWYVAVAIIIKANLFLFDLINKDAFRSSEGDVTTEIGYLEDGSGAPLQLTVDGEEPCHMPHVESIGGTNMDSV